MRVVGNLVARTGTYTNQAGEEKSRWLTVGKLFAKDDGTFSAKVEAMPIGTEWDGWLSVFPEREKEGAKQGGRSTGSGRPQARQFSGKDPDEDIPF